MFFSLEVIVSQARLINSSCKAPYSAVEYPMLTHADGHTCNPSNFTGVAQESRDYFLGTRSWSEKKKQSNLLNLVASFLLFLFQWNVTFLWWPVEKAINILVNLYNIYVALVLMKLKPDWFFIFFFFWSNANILCSNSHISSKWLSLF